VDRPSDLPDYRNSPIDEVAIGVQLISPIAGFVDPHAGLFWQLVKERYPQAESHPRVETVSAGLAPQTLGAPPFPFPFSGSAGSRTFLVSQDGSYLLQIQNNRFFRNWRKRDPEYPHFDALSNDFLDELAAFREFLSSEALEAPPIALFEVTYINWITDRSMRDFLLPAAAAELDTETIGSWPINEAWQAVYQCVDGSGQAVASLSAQCAPAARTTASSIQQGSQFAFTFSYPGKPELPVEMIPELLQQARRYIVRSFTQLTTPGAHEHWQRIQ
jgi:uncharacterized protein (TIGR04255 family)